MLIELLTKFIFFSFMIHVTTYPLSMIVVATTFCHLTPFLTLISAKQWNALPDFFALVFFENVKTIAQGFTTFISIIFAFFIFTLILFCFFLSKGAFSNNYI